MTARTRTTSLGAAFHLRTAEAVRRCRARSVGIRRQLPWGSGPSGVSTWAIVVLVCLSSTIRSQGFSPSQRFDPARALWLCFAPHPPIGFLVAFRAFPSRSAVTPLSALCSLVVSACAGFARASSTSTFAPAPRCPSRLFVRRKTSELFARATPKVSFSISPKPAPPRWCGNERAAEPADGG
jgi:hypothetical protein